MATNVYVPDQVQAVPLPKDGVTVEEARRLLAQVGYAGLENARGTVQADGSIKFERPVGGEKGRS